MAALDFRKEAAFVYVRRQSSTVVALTGAPLDSTSGPGSNPAVKTFLTGIIGVRAARDGAGASHVHFSMHGHGPVGWCNMRSRRPGAVVLRLCELCERSWAPKRGRRAEGSGAADLDAGGRSLCMFCGSPVGRSVA